MWKPPRWSHAPCLWDQHSTNLGQWLKSSLFLKFAGWSMKPWWQFLTGLRVKSCKGEWGGAIVALSFLKRENLQTWGVVCFLFSISFSQNLQTWGASSPQAEQVQDQESRHWANDSVWKVNERVYDEGRSSKCTRHRANPVNGTEYSFWIIFLLGKLKAYFINISSTRIYSPKFASYL